MMEATVPEMQRCNLAPVILQLKALGIHNVLRFNYISVGCVFHLSFDRNIKMRSLGFSSWVCKFTHTWNYAMTTGQT